MTKILLVEDEDDLRFSLVHNLGFEGYQVEEAKDGTSGLEKALNHTYDLILLDVMMPGMDGYDVLKQIRKQNEAVPIMMLTAKAAEMDKVIGLELGADDYMTKPFGLGEFLARIKALLRRNRVEAPHSTLYQFLDIEVDFENFSVRRDGNEVHFSQKELALLKYMIQRPDQAVSKTEVLEAIWGYESNVSSRTVDTHIARIRRKLGESENRNMIQTVPTVGYKFVAELGA